MLKKNVILIFLLSMFCFSIFAQVQDDWYKDKEIVSFKFKGLKVVQPSDLSGIFSKYKGKKFSDEIYLEILQHLYDLDYFIDIQPQAVPADPSYSYVRLEFYFVEKAFVKKIKFTGNNAFRAGTLLEKCTLKKDAIYNEDKLHSDTLSIKAFYLGKGYNNINVSTNVEEDKEDNSVSVEYVISEGKQTVVSKIFFEGNEKIADKVLKKVLATKEAGIIRNGAFQESAIENDKELVKFYYGEKGYINGHIENVRQEVDPESDDVKQRLILTYIIYEGEQFTYEGVSFKGNRIFKTDELEAKIKLEKGDVFNLKRLEVGYNAIADLYFENGYSATQISKKDIVDETSRTIKYEIEIKESKRSHVENVILRGNTKTKDYVILRELLFTSGDVFSKKRFFNSLRNIYNLRYFSSIVPDVKPGSEDGLLDVILNVEETSTANIQFGITFSGASDANTFPMSIFLQWEERNLVGRGSELSANVTAGPDKQSATLGYTENWFLGIPLAVGFELSATHKQEYSFQDILPPFGVPDPYPSLEDYKADISLAEAYKMKYDRAEFGFGINTSYRWYPLFATLTLRGGVNFNLVKNFYDDALYRPFDEAIRHQREKWRFSNNLWTRFSVDNRDFVYDPSKGWFLSQQFSFFGIFPKIESEYFFRSETKGELYFTLLDYPVAENWHLKFVLAFYSGFSFQIPTTGKNISRLNKLTIDGMFNGRGWYNAGVAGQGDVMQSNWVEFRMPLAQGIISFDFFFDAIATKQDLKSLKSLSINDYYFSFGPGIRFTLPQFPLRLMFANTFRSNNGKPYWGNGKGADWKFVLSFNIPNL
jgi:hypothetical protein